MFHNSNEGYYIGYIGIVNYLFVKKKKFRNPVATD
jgi:hypothetical protein